ncbi:MAG: response regulator transcription factor [Prolixibacteraceae bacterium]|jgi:DNA-binding NarL/FixJ family response regulator|nr:response regulator transcription factor [Prolixibacteraceae bacterium]MDI9563171.1 response regulator transcription factor [Bacteroidota bacterium]NLT00421.1 response regulator transcription factor [Bacteroidales bacterium]OQB81180.1 MAG: Oxygen regulatory protein NreC [Bacteroidetes bacterium ADurb.Bin123]HNZ68510.1 response regulator transcription factor [Prolixibacteraceae bacterium]
MATEVIRIAVVDDHTLFREGLVSLLTRGSQRFQVIWQASSGVEFLEKLEEDFPEVVLMDISMPVMDGIEATTRAVSLYSGIRIIALSMYGEQEYYLKMIQAGAKGFLRKDSDIEEVAQTILKVSQGENCFSQEMLYSLVTQPPVIRDEILSEREIQILGLICHGLSAAEIAKQLFLSKRTVEKHRANILDKTRCRNTANLVAWAMKNNYGT